MSIPMSVGEWLFARHGIDYNDLPAADKADWEKKYWEAPFPELFDGSGYQVISGVPAIVLNRGKWQKEYRSAEEQQLQRDEYGILPHTKTGDLLDYGRGAGCRWCDLHGCLHGSAYLCKHYSAELITFLSCHKKD